SGFGGRGYTFSTLASGAHHGGWRPEKNREHSIKLQLSAGNVGFMGRLHDFHPARAVRPRK
ncbi:hypothetical protein E0I00_29220, partial [Pseudomonas syringae pv. actinidiae]|nr:hypothetical protein [Pseudomonas syringae pv. actinidiae]